MDKTCSHCGATQQIPEWIIGWFCYKCGGRTDDKPDRVVEFDPHIQIMYMAELNRIKSMGRKPYKRFGKRG